MLEQLKKGWQDAMLAACGGYQLLPQLLKHSSANAWTSHPAASSLSDVLLDMHNMRATRTHITLGKIGCGMAAYCAT